MHTDTMFERFSSGYYLGRLYVEPHDGEGAAIARAQHERVNEQLYADEGVSRTDLPLVMKLENTHFAVGGDERVPEDTLAVPQSLVEDTDIRNPPSLREVFLAKADRARQLVSVARNTPGVPDPDATLPDPNPDPTDGDDWPDGPAGI